MTKFSPPNFVIYLMRPGRVYRLILHNPLHTLLDGSISTSCCSFSSTMLTALISLRSTSSTPSSFSRAMAKISNLQDLTEPSPPVQSSQKHSIFTSETSISVTGTRTRQNANFKEKDPPTTLLLYLSLNASSTPYTTSRAHSMCSISMPSQPLMS